MGTYTQKQKHQITPDKRDQNPQIPPAILKCKIQSVVKLISNFIRAILTHTCRVIHEIPKPAALEERRHIFPTRLAGEGREVLKLHRRAVHGSIVEFGDDHAADEASEGVELVQPSTPEFRDGPFGDGDAAEEREGDDDEGVEEGGDERGRGDCRDHPGRPSGRARADAAGCRPR